MIHETHLGSGWSKMIRETSETPVLVGHAHERTSHVQCIGIVHRKLPCSKAPEVAQKHPMRGRPSSADRIELIGADAGKFEARPDGMIRKSCIVLDSAKAFLRDRKQQFAVSRDARGRVMHL